MNIKSPSKPEDPVDEPDSVNHPNVSDIENLAKLQEESKYSVNKCRILRFFLCPCR